MAGKQVAGDGVPSSLAGMSKSQLYDIMCQMKALIEQNHQQARQILIQNPVLTRTLFQAQIMLGMVQPPQPISTAPPSAAQNSQQSLMPAQQSNIQAPSSFAGQIAPNQVRKQQSGQTVVSKPQSQSIPLPNPQTQSIPSQPLRSAQQPKGHLGPQSMPLAIPQPSQVPNLAPLPQHTAPPSSVHPSPMTLSSLPTQLQQSLQNTGAQYLPLQPPLQPSLQPPLPPQPRPQMPAFPHQAHSQMGPNLGFQHPAGQQMHHSQTIFHSSTVAPGLGPPFLQGQPPHPKQSVTSSLYQAGGPHTGMEFNQVGSSSQTDRGSNWMSGLPDVKASHFPGPQLVPNQIGPSSQPPRAAPLTPEMEKALLQQVMSLTPEQIAMLPAEQRNQILQLQQLLRQ